MAEDPEKPEPNLELPSLFGRGRKKKRRADPEDLAVDRPEDQPVGGATDVGAAAAPQAPGPEGLGFPGEDPVAAPEEGAASHEESISSAGPAPVAGTPRRLPPTRPPGASLEEPTPELRPEPSPEPTAAAADEATVGPVATAPPMDPAPAPEPEIIPPSEPGPPPVPAPAPAPDPVGDPAPDPEPAPPPTPVPPPAPEPLPPAPEPVPAPSPTSSPTTGPTTGPAAVPMSGSVAAGATTEQTTVLPGPVPFAEPAAGEPVAVPLDTDVEPGRRRAPRERRPMSLPSVNPRIAVVVTGVLVGLVGVLLTYAAGQGCEAVRGVGSCGGTGVFALLAVVAIEILLGALLLRAWGLPDPGSTSFLGVGLVAAMALLFFFGSLDSPWMLLVIPLLTAIAFLVSWWVTDSFVEQGADDNLHR